MKDNRLLLLVGVGGWLVMASMLGCDKPKQAKPVVKQEFVCYTDGKWTEIHFGVEAIAHGKYSNRVTIIYTDGQVSMYYPKAGESCQLETIRP